MIILSQVKWIILLLKYRCVIHVQKSIAAHVNSPAAIPQCGVPRWAINGNVPQLSRLISSLPAVRAGKLPTGGHMPLWGNALNPDCSRPLFTCLSWQIGRRALSRWKHLCCYTLSLQWLKHNVQWYCFGMGLQLILQFTILIPYKEILSKTLCNTMHVSIISH